MTDKRFTSFGQLIRIILMQSKLILSLSFLALFFLSYKYFTSDKQFMISTLLDFELKPTAVSQYNILQDIGNIDDYIGKYKSRSQTKKLIKTLNLNVFLDDIEVLNDIKFGTLNVRDFQEFYIVFEDNKFNIYDIKKFYYFKKL